MYLTHLSIITLVLVYYSGKPGASQKNSGPCAQFWTFSWPFLALWSGSGPSPRFRTLSVPLHFALHSVFCVPSIALQNCPHPPVHACTEGVEVLVTQVVPDTPYLPLHLGQIPRRLLLQFPLDQGKPVLDAWEEKGVNNFLHGSMVKWIAWEEKRVEPVLFEESLSLLGCVHPGEVLKNHQVVPPWNPHWSSPQHLGVLLRVHVDTVASCTCFCRTLGHAGEYLEADEPTSKTLHLQLPQTSLHQWTGHSPSSSSFFSDW